MEEEEDYQMMKEVDRVYFGEEADEEIRHQEYRILTMGRNDQL